MDTNATKPFSFKTAILLFLSVGLLTVGLSVFFQTRSQAVQRAALPASAAEAIPAGDPSPVTAAPAVVGLGSSFNVPGKPARLIIPAINVDAAVQSVGLYWRGDGTMGIPTNFTDVAWYNGGPVPGMPGNAVIDGHLDGRNVKEAVFYNLGNLKPGDLVEVVDINGAMLKFQVVRLVDYDYNATTTDIFSGDASKARLNLITCAGDWVKGKGIYNQRVVVFTELIPTEN
jgi:LPXTG-site transpeptidase (sortase) family protein